MLATERRGRVLVVTLVRPPVDAGAAGASRRAHDGAQERRIVNTAIDAGRAGCHR